MSDWRAATPADALPLADLERDANLVALAHVFPPADHPYPYDDVLDRWRTLLADPDVVVEVLPAAGRLDALLARDRDRLRHLAVHPDRWGSGLGAAAVARASAYGVTRLWCLAANERARRLYERLGWRIGGAERRAEWPPYPLEIEYLLDEPAGSLDASDG